MQVSGIKIESTFPCGSFHLAPGWIGWRRPFLQKLGYINLTGGEGADASVGAGKIDFKARFVEGIFERVANEGESLVVWVRPVRVCAILRRGGYLRDGVAAGELAVAETNAIAGNGRFDHSGWGDGRFGGGNGRPKINWLAAVQNLAKESHPAAPRAKAYLRAVQ